METTVDRSVILGIPVDHVNMEGALNRIMGMVNQYEEDAKARLVATANVDFIVNAHDRNKGDDAQELLSVLRSAEMVTADGMPLVWLSKMLGKPLEERVTGADMVPALAEKAAQEGKSIYFFGGIDGSAKRTAQILKEKHPDLQVAGYSNPMIDMDDEIENKVEIARINITKPDVLLIALGNPKQELWFNRYKKYLKVPVSMGIGGTFEFISGVTSRAPEWMQRVGLEWIYRMSQDPRRLINRYVKGLFTFNRMTLPLLLMNSIASRLKQSRSQEMPSNEPVLARRRTSEQELWTNIEAIQGLKGKIEVVFDARILMLDFSAIRALSSADAARFMDVFLEVQRLEMFCLVSGVSWLPHILFRLYRINDLLEAVAQSVVDKTGKKYRA